MFFRTSLPIVVLAAVIVTATLVSSLPTHGYHSHINSHSRILRRDSDDHGNVARHDSLEAQQHKLEEALQHYEQYGDAHSLEVYLKGFVDDNGGQSGSQEPKKDDKQQAAPQPSSGSGHGKEGNDDHSDEEDCEDDADDGAKGDDKDDGKDDGKGDNGDCDYWDDQCYYPPKQAKPQHKASSDYVAPPAPKQDAPKPAPAPEHKHDNPAPAPAPKPAPQPPKPDTSSSSSSSSNSISGYTPPAFPSADSTSCPKTTFTGHATYYDTGLGACGITNSNNQPIVAVSRDVFSQYTPSSGNPNHNSLCGKKVEIEWQGKKMQAFAMDECPSCEGTSLDLSPSVFEGLDNKEKGVLDGITWRFV